MDISEVEAFIVSSKLKSKTPSPVHKSKYGSGVFDGILLIMWATSVAKEDTAQRLFSINASNSLNDFDQGSLGASSRENASTPFSIGHE